MALSAAGDLEALAPGGQLTGYRIVQEGLTNVLKHTGTAQTDVVIRIADSDRLAVRIASAAGEQRAGLPGSASGLRSLQERVEATGRSPDTGVIMPTTFDVDGYAYAALSAGASGFLLKDIAPE